MSCCFSPTAVKGTLKTKSVSEGRTHKKGSVYGEEMDLGGSHLCGRGLLLHGTNSCCSSMFSFASPRLVSARAIFSHVHPSLLLSRPQALQESSPFTTGSMERSKHFCVLSLSLLHLCGNFPEAGKLACHSVGAASFVSAALAHRFCSGAAECCGQVYEGIPWNRYSLSRSVLQTLLKSLEVCKEVMPTSLK